MLTTIQQFWRQSECTRLPRVQSPAGSIGHAAGPVFRRCFYPAERRATHLSTPPEGHAKAEERRAASARSPARISQGTASKPEQDGFFHDVFHTALPNVTRLQAIVTRHCRLVSKHLKNTVAPQLRLANVYLEEPL